jgi:predicted kinase
VHLISGLPCSGKTTYATGLRADVDGVLYSLDWWLITAFGKYAISSVGHEEHTRRQAVSFCTVRYGQYDVDDVASGQTRC